MHLSFYGISVDNATKTVWHKKSLESSGLFSFNSILQGVLQALKSLLGILRFDLYDIMQSSASPINAPYTYGYNPIQVLKSVPIEMPISTTIYLHNSVNKYIS